MCAVVKIGVYIREAPHLFLFGKDLNVFEYLCDSYMRFDLPVALFWLLISVPVNTSQRGMDFVMHLVQTVMMDYPPLRVGCDESLQHVVDYLSFLLIESIDSVCVTDHTCILTYVHYICA